MTLITRCHRCFRESQISLPDGMSEGEVARIAASFICVECAAKHQAEQARRQEETSCRTCGSKGWRTMDELKALVDSETAEARKIIDRAERTLQRFRDKPAAKPATTPPSPPAVVKPQPKPGLTVPSWAKAISVDTKNNQSQGTNEKPSKKRIYV